MRWQLFYLHWLTPTNNPNPKGITQEQFNGIKNFRTFCQYVKNKEAEEYAKTKEETPDLDAQKLERYKQEFKSSRGNHKNVKK